MKILDWYRHQSDGWCCWFQKWFDSSKNSVERYWKWDGLIVLKTNAMVAPPEASPDVDVNSFFVLKPAL